MGYCWCCFHESEHASWLTMLSSALPYESLSFVPDVARGTTAFTGAAAAAARRATGAATLRTALRNIAASFGITQSNACCNKCLRLRAWSSSLLLLCPGPLSAPPPHLSLSCIHGAASLASKKKKEKKSPPQHVSHHVHH